METGDGLKIGRKTFIGTTVMLLAVMAVAGILTLVLPLGQFDRVELDGRSTVVPGSYHETTGARLPIWRWITAPVEVFAGPDAAAAILIILFVLFIGGTFLILEKSGVLKYLLSVISRKFAARKYQLLAATVFVCMLLGSTVGLFEETVTLVPITVALALSLGWDSLVGIGMSVLSVGFGFAAGTLNPFTVAVTQKLAQLPINSGLLFRIVIFAVVYALLMAFLTRYAKRVERKPELSPVFESDAAMRRRFSSATSATGALDSPGVAKAAAFFGVCLLLVFAYVLAGFYLRALSDYSMPVMALLFTIGGIGAGLLAGGRPGAVLGHFAKGMASLLPGAVLILLAMSAKQIMLAGGIMDTLLHNAYGAIGTAGPYGAVMLLYGFVLLLELFIGGSTAKAFLIMPLVVPLADLIGLTRQTSVQAFIMADGFANMIYPTNAVLLITIGLVGVPYIKWLKWTWKLQLAVAALSVACLAVAVAIGYGPF